MTRTEMLVALRKIIGLFLIVTPIGVVLSLAVMVAVEVPIVRLVIGASILCYAMISAGIYLLGGE